MVDSQFLVAHVPIVLELIAVGTCGLQFIIGSRTPQLPILYDVIHVRSVSRTPRESELTQVLVTG